MKIAVITTAIGAPRTLASTAFIGAFVDGLANAGVGARVIGLTQTELGWHPEALRPFETSAPWLSAPSPRALDRVAAARLGILEEARSSECSLDGRTPDWYLELLLQRELQAFAHGQEDVAVMVYPRSYAILNTAARIARRCGWRLLIFSTEALIDDQIDPATRDAYIRCVVDRCDGVWVLSDYLAEYWQANGVPGDRVFVNPPAVRDSSFAADEAPRTYSAVYIGNLRYREIEYLLDISEVVSRQLPEFNLTIYGDATDEQRSELVEAIGARALTGIVVLKPSVQPSDVPGVLRKADVLVLPRSAGEYSAAGFPNKLGEYLASGRPVVVTGVGDIPKYLVNGESAFLVAPDDCEAFAEALLTPLSQPELAEEVGANGRSVAERLLASPGLASRIVGFIEGLPTHEGERADARVRWSRFVLACRQLRPEGNPPPDKTVPAARADHDVERKTEQLRRTFARRLLYTPGGHTRIVAFKMAVVRVLRALHLGPPPPGA